MSRLPSSLEERQMSALGIKIFGSFKNILNQHVRLFPNYPGGPTFNWNHFKDR